MKKDKYKLMTEENMVLSHALKLMAKQLNGCPVIHIPEHCTSDCWECRANAYLEQSSRELKASRLYQL